MAEWRSSKTQDEEQMRELERLQMKYSKVLAKVIIILDVETVVFDV